MRLTHRSTRVTIAFVFCSGAIFLCFAPILFSGNAAAVAPLARQQDSSVQIGKSYHNDVSPPLRDLAALSSPNLSSTKARPELPLPSSMQAHPSAASQSLLRLLLPDMMPPPILVFDGIPFGVEASRPPNGGGEAGATQYVQVVNDVYEVFDKNTGVPILGPTSLSAIWSGFGGSCQTGGLGLPSILYDQLANRWLISQLAGEAVITDQCVAVSTTNDATGTWNRYAFHLGSNNFFDQKLSVWPDGYYMSSSVFNSSEIYLGPQPWAFDRTRMLAGMSASFITTGVTIGPDEAPYLPADFDGSVMPPAGAPNSFIGFPATGHYRVFHFHADFANPNNSSFTLFASPPAAGFIQLCPGNPNCVPQLGGSLLDPHANRLMPRLAYRNLGTSTAPNESLVGNFTVSSNGVAGIRWFEIKNVTSGPVTVVQDSTYQPDADWRWLGSAAMDHLGNLAIGFSASSSVISPQIRYAGRLAKDPPNTLAQGEAHLFDGTGSQVGSSAWGDLSDLTIDPVDDCTFWYTNKYYTMSGFSWRTKIGKFKFTQCTSATPSPTPSPSPATPTPTSSPTPTPTASCVSREPPCFDWSVSMTDSPDPVEVSSNLTYTITADLNGPAGPTSVEMRDTLPTGVDFVSVTTGNGTCTGTSTINCNLIIVPGMVGVTVTLVVTPTMPGTLSNTAIIFPGPGDVNPNDDSYTATTTVIPATSPTPTPTPTPAAQALNLSTRLRVQTDENVGIGGFIVAGTAPKRVILRAIGPSLSAFGVPDPVADPVLELHGPSGFTTVTNDNWRDTQETEITATGLAPTNNFESAIVATLDPGAYTGIIRGKNNTTGVALIEAYDLNQAVTSKLANISTRAFVSTGSNIVVAGFILGGNNGFGSTILRGLGPSLTPFGVPNALSDPTLELRNSNGALLLANDDWQDDPTQAAMISAAGLAPVNALESGIAATLAPGQYTVLLAGLNNETGVGLVEVYDVATP